MEPSISLEELKGRLLDLKQRFVQKMPDRILEIATTLAACIAGEGEAVARLERQFHTLAGTAGTYELGAVAATAFEGEAVCAGLKTSSLDSDTLEYLTFLVDQLRGALAADAPAQWAARTVLTAADSEDAASERNGVSVA
jgi:chemotaxis protein histidine kinase CheA